MGYPALVRPAGPTATPTWLREGLGLITLNSSDEDVRGWFQRHADLRSPRRRWQCQRAALNLWFYLGRQWIEARAELAPGNGTYHFRELYRRSSATFPRPVTNIIGPSIDNEVARLSRKEYIPDTSAGKNEPQWMAAARLAKDIVKSNMATQIWDAKREQAIFTLCTDGIVGLRTWWDENDVETTLVAAPDQRTCPGCGAKFASARVPQAMVEAGLPGPEGPMPFQHTETLQETEPAEGESAPIPQVEMRMCPMCAEPTPLKEYEISEEEALATDAFGRPMGLLVPRGEGTIDVVSMHELCPENGGVGVEPHESRLVAQAKVQALEWIALRYPEIADKLSPENPKDLLMVHPLYSEASLAGAYGESTYTSRETYSNHAMVKEAIVKPQPHIPGLEQGGHFCLVGHEVVRRELCVEVQGEDRVRMVPRIKYHFARFKRLPKLFHGRTFVDDLIPLQRRLNELDAQVIDLRERGKPNMWIPQGTEIKLRPDSNGGAFEVIEFDSSMSNWTPQQGIFPGQALTGNAYLQEREQILRDAQALGAPQDIEMGRSPGSVKTTSGLMLLSEESSLKRGPVERGLVSMYEGAFEHILELNHAFRQEDEEYDVVTEAGIYERKTYTGRDLKGSIRVKMNARPGYDEVLYNKEATAEAIDRGLYRLDTPAAIDRALDNMRLPKDINQKQTFQLERANMAWTDFARERKIPVIDPTIHDPAAWYSVLSDRWLSDEGFTLQQEGRWEEILPALANWEIRKAQFEAEDQQQKQMYGSIPPEQWQAKYEQGQALRAQAVQAVQESAEVQAAPPPGMPAPPPQPPPQIPEIPPPPLDGFLPEQLELRIYAVWMRMLPEIRPGILAVEAAQGLKAPMDSKLKALATLNNLLKMRAVIEAYRQMLMSMAAPPPAPGPGAPGPAPGPGPGTPPAPKPGEPA